MNSSKPQGIILVIGSHTSLHISGVHVNRFLSVHLSIHSLQDRAQFASKVRACPLCAEFIPPEQDIYFNYAIVLVKIA